MRLTIADGDAVLMCMPVESAGVVMPGSSQVHCDECDRLVWRAPGKPVVRLSDAGELVPNILGVQPTIVLCIPCARMHQAMP